MRTLILLSGLALAVSSKGYSRGGGEAAPPFDRSESIYQYCLSKHPSAIAMFEDHNNISFSAVIKNDLQHNPAHMPTSEAALQSYCQTLFGYEYGKVEFRSNPRGAKIYVNGELEEKKTNSTLAYHVGEYDFQIELAADKKCQGHVKVERNHKSVITCP